jgi:hypothetical protein
MCMKHRNAEPIWIRAARLGGPPERKACMKRILRACRSEHASWCGRRDLNLHGPCGPTDFLALYGFVGPGRDARHGDAPSGLWSGLSLHHSRQGRRCCPSSLHTFPSGVLRPGLVRDRRAFQNLLGIVAGDNLATLQSIALPRWIFLILHARLRTRRLYVQVRP